MAPSEEDIKQMIAGKVHIGKKLTHVNINRYVWKKRRADGLMVINLQKTWYKLQLAARIIAAVKNPEDVMVMSARQFGQRGAIKFAHYTGATAHVQKWVPGTFCNPQNKAFCEPRLVIVDDPMTCFGALRETSYMGIPVIAFCNTDNNLRFVDCAIPSNNRGCLSLGLMFWMLAREVVRIRDKTISHDRKWDAAPVDLFFYRDPDRIKRQLEQKADKERKALQTAEQATDLPEDGYYEEYIAPVQHEYQDMGLEHLQAYQMDAGAPVMDDWGADQFAPYAAQDAGTYGQSYQAPYDQSGGAYQDPSGMQQW
jgi:small subunit ribosomal protein SAe